MRNKRNSKRQYKGETTVDKKGGVRNRVNNGDEKSSAFFTFIYAKIHYIFAYNRSAWIGQILNFGKESIHL